MSGLRIDPDWLRDPALQRLLATLCEGGEEARIVGGPVRNALFGLAANDIDVATTTLPQETVARVEAAGFKAVPTGIAHGTITVVADGRPFEVTTLREDIETDGRRAKVKFGRDWSADAGRRDFTINALYADADGRVIDLVGGAADIETRTLRFIGDAEARIREDYLRILRFYRFFAWYGHGRPDAAGIKASAKLKQGMAQLSPERVWSELKKLLSASDPGRALLWMRQAGVLTTVLPESEKWGIDTIAPLIEAETAFRWSIDPMLRLMAILPPDPERLAALAKRLRLANIERDRLIAFAMAAPVDPEETDASLRARLYYGERQAIADRLRLALVSARNGSANPVQIARLSARLSEAEKFDPPAFPVGGDDLRAAGVEAGPGMGRELKRLEQLWVESGFTMTRGKLLGKTGSKPATGPTTPAREVSCRRDDA